MKVGMPLGCYWTKVVPEPKAVALTGTTQD
jgi:hypothetical protein